MNRSLVIASHVALIEGKEYDGIGNVLRSVVPSLTKDFIYLRNSIDGKLPSEIHYYNGETIKRVEKLKVWSGFGPLRYASEYWRTVNYFKSENKSIDVYVGIDPLNSFSAIRLKKIGIVKKVIFYTADYSPKRFSNPLLNYIYHAIDRHCVKNADEVWSVSSRICDVRRKMNLAEEKNIFIPNVPPTEFDNFKKNKHDRYRLVTTGIIDKQLDFEGLIKAVSKLRGEFPMLNLTIIGNGPEEDTLRRLTKRLKVKDRVIITGRLPFKEALEIQSKSGIGLALYTGLWGFNFYGDSTKCREYFNFGLPIISTDSHSTVEEILESKSGEIVELKCSAYIKAIRKIINNYDAYSKASSIQGKRYRGVHAKHLRRLLRIGVDKK